MKKSIRFSTNISEIRKDDLIKLFSSVGFGEPEAYLHIENLVAKMWPSGAYGFFAHVYDQTDESQSELVGMCRIFSDDIKCAWLAEVCVLPIYQHRGIGSSIMKIARKRFNHTAFYAFAFKGQEEFFSEVSLTPKTKLVVCSSRMPYQAIM